MFGLNTLASAVKTAVNQCSEFITDVRDGVEDFLWRALSAYLGRCDIKSVEAWDNCYFVTFFNGSPTFVGKKFIVWVIVSILSIIATSGYDDSIDPEVVFIPAIQRTGGYILLDSKHSGVFVPNESMDNVDLSLFWQCGRREIALMRARDLSRSESLRSALGLYSLTTIAVRLV